MKMGSVDLTVYQESSRDIPYFQVGRDEQMRLSEGRMNSKVNMDQQVKLTVEEEEEESEHSEEWLSIFSNAAEKTATWEVAEAEDEEADNICFVELWDQIEALEERVKVQGMHIQQVKLEMNKEGVGDHDDLPNGQNFLQLRRLQELNQPLEQLEEVIMEIMELMLKSTDTTSREQLGRRKEAAAV
jgi:hypothetical protein